MTVARTTVSLWTTGSDDHDAPCQADSHSCTPPYGGAIRLPVARAEAQNGFEAEIAAILPFPGGRLEARDSSIWALDI